MGLSRFSSLITRKRFSFFIGLILCAAFAGIFTSPVFAEYQYADGIITDSNDVRWEYLHVRDSETAKESVTIKYFDKPSNATTIVVPSLSEVLTLIPNVSQTLDTYFLDDAFSEYQAAHFSEVKRESIASVNKLDMSNTAKIQIQGVDPIIDPEVETELIFGDQMVIGDGVPRSKLTLRAVCTEFDDYHIRRCIRMQDQEYVVAAGDTNNSGSAYYTTDQDSHDDEHTRLESSCHLSGCSICLIFKEVRCLLKNRIKST